MKMQSKTHYLTGYPSLVAFLSNDQDKTTTVYKRFDRLAARNLLCLQSLIARFQAQQDALNEEYMAGGLETKQCTRNW
jgi:hypothetical protein